MTETLSRPRLVVAWDGSQLASLTFPLAAVLGSQLGAQVDVLHVLEQGETAEGVHEAFGTLRGGLGNGGHLHVERGDVVEAIVEAAADPSVPFVILATHVESIRGGRHLGSIAEGVIDSTVSPILLVRPEASLAPREIKRLLLPLDGTPRTAVALQPAIQLAGQMGASLDVLYVGSAAGTQPTERGSIRVPQYVDQPQHAWPEWGDEVIERLVQGCARCPADMAVRLWLGSGDIGAEIERFAREHSSDAVVLVRRSGLKTDRGLVIRSVLAQTPCPAIIVGGPAAFATPP